MILYLKNMTNEPIPNVDEEGKPTEHPPCWNGEHVFEFAPGEVIAMAEKPGRIIAKVWHPRIQVVQTSGEGEVLKPDFTVGTDEVNENFGAAHDRPGPKPKKKG